MPARGERLRRATARARERAARWARARTRSRKEKRWAREREAFWEARLRRFRRLRAVRRASDRLWGGSRYFTNRAIDLIEAGVSSRKRVETFGNPGSDHHVSQRTADAVDFQLAEAHGTADLLARHLGGPDDIVDYQHFYVRNPHNRRVYRLQIIAGTHGTGPHLHLGVRRA